MVIDPFKIAQTGMAIQDARSRLSQMQQNKQLGQARLAQMERQNQENQSSRAIKFGANVARQIQESPDQAPAIYNSARTFAQKQGFDVSEFPEQYDPQAQQYLDIMYNQVYNPEQQQQKPTTAMLNIDYYQELQKTNPDAARMFAQSTNMINGPAAAGQTSTQKDFATFQRLKKEDPQAAEIFGKQAGFITSEGDELSSHLQKRLSASTDAAVEASNNSRKFMVLSDQIAASPEEFSGGLFSSWSEGLKNIIGSQDAISELRTAYNSIRSSQAVTNLPPGVASDKDIELALSGFPKQNSNATQITSFLMGLSKLEDVREQFNQFNADYISSNGHERGMLDAWKKAGGTTVDDTQQSMSHTSAQAPIEAIEHLKQNPDTIDQFEEYYNYRPTGF